MHKAIKPSHFGSRPKRLAFVLQLLQSEHIHSITLRMFLLTFGIILTPACFVRCHWFHETTSRVGGVSLCRCTKSFASCAHAHCRLRCHSGAGLLAPTLAAVSLAESARTLPFPVAVGADARLRKRIAFIDFLLGDAVLGLCSGGSRFSSWSPGPERLPPPSDWPLGLACSVEGSVQPWTWPPQAGPGRTRSLRGEAFRASGSCLPEYK